MDGCKRRETEMDVDDNGKRMNEAPRRVCEWRPATERKARTVTGGPARGDNCRQAGSLLHYLVFFYAVS